MNADGADFAFSAGSCGRQPFGQVFWRGETAPDACEAADAPGRDTVDSAEADERFLDEADEVDRAEAIATVGVAEAAQVEDGIADELAGAVIGDVAAAVDFMEGDAAASKKLIRCQNVGAVCVAAEGENGGMFEEQEGVVDLAL